MLRVVLVKRDNSVPRHLQRVARRPGTSLTVQLNVSSSKAQYDHSIRWEFFRRKLCKIMSSTVNPSMECLINLL